MPAQKASAPLTRAASLGLSLGIAVAGIVLMALSVRMLYSQASCEGMTSTECMFEQNLEQGYARWQFWVGAALELLAIAGLLWIRAEDRKARRSSTEPPAP